MPAIAADYEVLLKFANDTHHCAALQLARDYNRNGGTMVLLEPGEFVTLVLNAGSIYRYVLKTRSKVASLSARAWRDVTCTVAQAFAGAGPEGGPVSPVVGVTVDRIWRDYRFMHWDD
ncbi:hypothetical protein K488DRAFT_45786 [Vararia minispora EC-137]|uniref:Uncharacterized protein n=1 Tax=Vararia minispora EC-137 TaxID=1314806 RepID=A0ACB8QRZ6_9AGAM|nr:hypothetical protein K488DRAFT_45786 [Vararia minispora EC-137]